MMKKAVLFGVFLSVFVLLSLTPASAIEYNKSIESTKSDLINSLDRLGNIAQNGLVSNLKVSIKGLESVDGKYLELLKKINYLLNHVIQKLNLSEIYLFESLMFFLIGLNYLKKGRTLQAGFDLSLAVYYLILCIHYKNKK